MIGVMDHLKWNNKSVSDSNAPSRDTVAYLILYLSKIILAFWLVPIYDHLEDRRIDDVINIII